MSIQANASQLMQYIGDTIGLDLSSVDFADNYMCLGVNEDSVLQFVLNEEHKECILSIDFARPTACLQNTSDSERALVLSFFLGANVLRVGTNGASLGYDEATDTLSLATSFDIPDDVTQSTKEAFYAKMERLLETYASWTATIESFATEAPAQEEAPVSVENLAFSLRI